MSAYEFSVIFKYEREAFKFTYRIEKDAYDVFYDIINDFFCEELSEDQLEEISKVSTSCPELTGTLEFCEAKGKTLRDIFDRDFIVTGVKKITDNQYEILWAT